MPGGLRSERARAALLTLSGAEDAVKAVKPTVLGRAEGIKAKAAQRDLHGEPEGACARNGHTFNQLHKLHRLADTSDLQA